MRKCLVTVIGMALAALCASASHAALDQWVLLRPQSNLTSVAVVNSPAPSPYNLLFLGSFVDNVGVQRSADGGASWTPVLFQRTHALAGDPNTPGVVYAATVAGLYKSVDYGDTWTLLTPSVKAWIAVNPANPLVLYGDNLKSVDGGQMWTAMTGLPPMPVPSFWTTDVGHIQVSPSIPQKLVAYVPSRNAYLSNDAGNSWMPMPNLQRVDVYTVAIDPVDARYHYVGYCNYVQRFTPTGTDMAVTGGDEFNVAVHPRFRNLVYVAGQFGETWRSTDFGVSYLPYATVPNSSEGMSGRMVIDNTSGRIYLPTDKGFWMAETIATPGCTDADRDGYYLQPGCGTPVDCNDNNAAVHPGATESCADGIDNDCDGLVDCEDPGCRICTDGDGDGYAIQGGCCGPVDCNDNNAAVHPGATESCADEIDNDCDGRIDCTDPDCGLVPPCYCRARETGYCANGIDDDCDGKTDCADRDCSRDPACQIPKEVCNDGIDNDGDGLTDCADPDCSKAKNCR